MSGPRPARTGLLLLDKPAGITSHDAVRAVRRAFGQREVGHAGTLDPMATGLLVVALGRATRLLRFVEAAAKRYTGTVCLGIATETYDAEGRITAEAPVGPLDRGAVAAALASLEGQIEQAVPPYSAVKVGGERLHAKARRGEAFTAPVRTVTVHALIATRVAPPWIDIEARVSKGTYVRSLAVQIGAQLGLPAHLSALRRTEIGGFSVDAARPIAAIEGRPEELLPIGAAVAHLPALEVDPTGAEDVRHGRRLGTARVQAGLSAPIAPGDAVRIERDGALLAIGLGRDDGGLDYACVLGTID
jgi:tRNA pseudouridine55 synthase